MRFGTGLLVKRQRLPNSPQNTVYPEKMTWKYGVKKKRDLDRSLDQHRAFLLPQLVAPYA